MSRNRIWLLLILLFAVGIFLVDVILLPGIILPSPPYFVPVVLAAYLLQPRWAAVVAGFTLMLRVLSDLDKQTPLWTMFLFAVALLIVSYLSIALSARTRREAALAEERKRLLAEVGSKATETARERDKIRALIDSIADEIWFCDASGRVTLVNEAALKGLGLERPEQAYAPISQLVSMLEVLTPDGRPRTDVKDAPLFRSLQGETIKYLEELMRNRKTGELRYRQVTSSPVKDQDGLIVGSVAVVRDITEQKRAQEERERLIKEIDERRRLFEAVIENASVGISVLRGPNFVFELINPAYQAIAPGKVILGRTVAEVWPELADQALPLLQRVLKTGEPFSATDMKFPLQRVPEGPVEEVYLTFSYVPLGAIKGQTDSILALVIETTDEVRARTKIEELAAIAQRRAAELQGVLDNMVDAVFACDASGRLTTVNKAGLEQLRLDSLEQFKSPLVEFPKLHRSRHLDGKPLAPEELPLLRALKGETIILEDEIVYDPGAQRDVYIRTSAAPIRDDEGKIVGAVSVVRDVTALTELDRLKDQFILVAAHELKTPVAIMKGYAQALLRTTEAIPEPRRKMLDGINRGADRIDRIVKDLLDISQLHLDHLELYEEKIDLPEMVEGVVTRIAATTAKHHIRVVRAEQVVIQGDRDRLEQVLVNLLDNAIKYSPKGGDIDIVVELRDHEAVVSITDHGIGIPREKQGHIFERFYSAHTGTPYDYGGMGVGLFISTEIVRRHGGRMWFESEEGKGSSFHFSLPLRGEPAGG